jgi:hypothetical protein
MIALSLIIGCSIGLVYGLSFALQQRRVFLDHTTSPKSSILIALFLLSFRLIFFALTLLYILHLPSINLILILMSFIVTVWYCITHKRARPYEWF